MHDVDAARDPERDRHAQKIFKDFFTFRPGKGQRSWLDIHNIISVTALPIFVLMTYSGLIFFMHIYIPAAMNVAYGSAAIWPNDGYGNPLNPRANNRFDGEEARQERPTPRAQTAPARPVTDLARLAHIVEGK